MNLKHLSPYLPYKLKILNGWGDIKTLTYTYLDDENNGFFEITANETFVHAAGLCDVGFVAQCPPVA